MGIVNKRGAVPLFLAIVTSLALVSSGPAQALIAQTSQFPLTAAAGDISADSHGDLYAIDTTPYSGGSDTFTKYTTSGTLLYTVGSTGSGDGQFNQISDIAISTTDRVYVSDCNNHRVQIFDADGNYVAQFGTNGLGNGQFDCPNEVAVASNGNVYVSDIGNRRVQVFDQNGVFNSVYLSGIDILSMTFGPNGNLYTTNGDSVVVYSPLGATVMTFGSFGPGDGDFSQAQGIAIAPNGEIFTLERGLYGNTRVQRFSTSGQYKEQFGTSRLILNGLFSDSLGGIAIVGTSVYVSDKGNAIMHVLNVTDTTPPTETSTGTCEVLADTGDNQLLYFFIAILVIGILAVITLKSKRLRFLVVLVALSTASVTYPQATPVSAACTKSAPPIATNDHTSFELNSPITIQLLANDVTATGRTINLESIDLDPTTEAIDITFNDPSGRYTLTYNSSTGKLTLDLIDSSEFINNETTVIGRYTFTDNTGEKSNVATLSISVFSD